jgi:propanol-preferring alcohol dehydrogenase
MSLYRAVEVTGSRQFAFVERETRDPLPGHVRLRVEACGVCHSDTIAVEGMRANPAEPIVPGHEVIGVIDAGRGRCACLAGWRPGRGRLPRSRCGPPR